MHLLSCGAARALSDSWCRALARFGRAMLPLTYTRQEKSGKEIADRFDIVKYARGVGRVGENEPSNKGADLWWRASVSLAGIAARLVEVVVKSRACISLAGGLLLSDAKARDRG